MAPNGRAGAQPDVPWTAYAALAAAPLFWAGNWVVGRWLVARWHPVEITFLRWVIGGWALLGLVRRREGRLPVPDRPTLAAVAASGFLGMVAYTLLQYEALRHTQAINGTLIFTATPAVTLLLAWLVLHEPLRPVQLAGVGLTLAGVAVILSGGSLEALRGLRVNLGDGLLLLADAMWAAYTVAARRFASHLSPLAFTAYSMVAAVVWLLPAQAALWGSGRSVLQAGQARWPDLAALLYVGAFASAAAYVFWGEGVRRIGAGPASVFGNLLPVFTALLATVFLGERLRLYHLFGALMVMAGVYACARPAVAVRPGGTAPR